jgi:hypothetical protein
MDSLFSFPVGLFHPLQHAGLPRRTRVARDPDEAAESASASRLAWRNVSERRLGTSSRNNGGDSGEAERPFRREAERHSGMIPNTIGA